MALTLGIPIFYRFFFLVPILEHIVALPWVTRRQMTWDDSPGQAIIDSGAAGLGALEQYWNQLLMPSPDTEDLPDEIELRPETSNPPEWSTPTMFRPNMMGKCSASPHSVGDLPGQGNFLALDGSLPGVKEEYGGNYVPLQQDPKTGRPLMDTCGAPDDKPEDAYLVQEINFVDEAVNWRQWRLAILVTDFVTQIDIRYDLERKGGKLVPRKVPNYKFLRQNAVVKLGYLRRHGWLVGAGEPKEAALVWFEGVLKTVKQYPAPSTTGRGVQTPHYTNFWVRKVFNKLSTETSPHWVPIITG